MVAAALLLMLLVATEHFVHYPASAAARGVLTLEAGEPITLRQFAYGALAVLFLVLCVGWLTSLRKSQRLAAQLHVLQLQHLACANRDDDAARMAREIHDDLGQKLVVMRMSAALLARAAASDASPRMQESIDDIKNQIDATITSVRAIVDNRPPPELARGLMPAINRLLAEFRDCFSFDIQFNNRVADNLSFAKGVEATAFRVIQESMSNAAKYARAKLISLDISHEGPYLIIRMTDDGVGFSAYKKPALPRSLRERVTAAGGWMSINNLQGGGACVEVSLPAQPCFHRRSTLHEALI